MRDDTTTRLPAVSVDETKLKAHVDEVVRGIVEETLNTLLDAVADRICRAQRYERSPERADTRAGLCLSHPGTLGLRLRAVRDGRHVNAARLLLSSALMPS